MGNQFQPGITVFHCINIFGAEEDLPKNALKNQKIRFVQMPCSGMVKDVFLLKAFETGSDGVLVMVCPEGLCRYMEGNIRAKKRVAFVRGILDEIGLDSNRISIHEVSSEDHAEAVHIIKKTMEKISEMGPNPAA